jgi:hypothetical protein
MTLVVPLATKPAQRLRTTLSHLACTINLYQKPQGLFLDLLVDDVLMLGGVLCLDRVLIVRDLYFGFIGDLAFVDTQARDDPDFTGLGTRWLLFYLNPGDFTPPPPGRAV